ncbi:MAG: hypothetical protein IH945_10220 [Armatimonadetes bacterium]|nr:hypothetical protein [Armatimonadota bacterium]
MKKFALAAIVAAVGLTSVATAQLNESSGIALRGGLFFPSSGSARAEGKTWFGVGIDYKLKDASYRRSPGGFDRYYTVSLDYYGKGDHSNMPIMINMVARREKMYYTLGAGLGFAKTPKGAGDQTNTEFTYQFGIGMDFQEGETPFFIEGRYFGSAESKLSGFAVYAGIRF